jgi:hypothetical protein
MNGRRAIMCPMKKGDTVEVTTKVVTTHWLPISGESRFEKLEIPPGTVLVGELLMNTSDIVKIMTDGAFRDFKRKEVSIKVTHSKGL